MSLSSTQLNVIPARSGTAFVLRRGATLTIVDTDGEQVADLIAFDAADPREALSNGRTFDYESTVMLSTGNRLWSNRSNPMLTIVRDDVGRHDFLLTPCSRDTWRLCYDGAHDDVPGCFGNLAEALQPYGIAADAIPVTFNVFMRVDIDERGVLSVLPPASRAGDRFAVRAERDLIVGLTACSALQSNNGRCTPIAWNVED